MCHSIALLLPDGRVLPRINRTVVTNFGWKSSSTISFRPTSDYRAHRRRYCMLAISIHTPQAQEIKWVQLIRPMATTHSCEPGQRIIDIPFEAGDFCHIHGKVTSEQNIAPPGWYMLFLVNRDGVPSVAKWTHLTGGKKPNHDPAFIKEMIDMRMTGQERPVPGTLGMDHDRHAPARQHTEALNERSSRPAKRGQRENVKERAVKRRRRSS